MRKLASKNARWRLGYCLGRFKPSPFFWYEFIYIIYSAFKQVQVPRTKVEIKNSCGWYWNPSSTHGSTYIRNFRNSLMARKFPRRLAVLWHKSIDAKIHVTNRELTFCSASPKHSPSKTTWSNQPPWTTQSKQKFCNTDPAGRWTLSFGSFCRDLLGCFWNTYGRGRSTILGASWWSSSIGWEWWASHGYPRVILWIS